MARTRARFAELALRQGVPRLRRAVQRPRRESREPGLDLANAGQSADGTELTVRLHRG